MERLTVKLIALAVAAVSPSIVGTASAWSAETAPSAAAPASAPEASAPSDAQAPRTAPALPPDPQAAPPARPSLMSLLEGKRAEHRIPALVAVATRADQVLEIAASGIRREGQSDPVSSEDRFHIGSNTKAMTATLIAILIEKGQLSWTSTPLDAMPELTETIRPEYRDITIVDLLSHHAGMASYEDTDNPEFREVKSIKGSPEEQRKEFARRALQRAPAVPPRTKGVYSNGGFAIAGAMAERAGHGSYESLMQSLLFEPLGIHPVFGWPARSDAHQPWGHYEAKQCVRPHDPSDAYRLPPFLVPAGDVSISAGDYARFLQLHLRGLEGRDGLLKSETIKRLHTKVDEKFALGWGIQEVEGATASVHAGSADTFYAVVALWPSRDLGAAVFANAGGDRAAKACGQILRAMAHRYDP